jgi:hypothetical protein
LSWQALRQASTRPASLGHGEIRTEIYPSWAVAAIKRAATDVRMMADLAGDYLFSDYAFERP